MNQKAFKRAKQIERNIEFLERFWKEVRDTIISMKTRQLSRNFPGGKEQQEEMEPILTQVVFDVTTELDTSIANEINKLKDEFNNL